MLKHKIAVLVSGGGTNLQALIDAQKAGRIQHGEIALVLSDTPEVYALTRAQENGIAAVTVAKKNFADKAQFEQKMLTVLAEHHIELIVLAGFLSILSEDFVHRYEERIINIHPSLIPAFCGQGFYGLKVHRAALARGVKLSGATVHFVNKIPDGGKIIAQKTVAVLPDDTPEALQQRIMEQAEWQLLPAAVEQVCRELSTQEVQ